MSDYRVLFYCSPEYKDEVWPKFFGEGLLPRTGEMVRSYSGMSLYVFSIVHSEESPGPHSIPMRHLIEITLHEERPK